MDEATRLVRYKTDASAARPVSTPIYQTSAFISGDPYFYTRKSNPNFSEVEEIMRPLDGGEMAVMFSSGMASISATLHLLNPGQRLVVNQMIYGCSYRFITDFCAQFHIGLKFVDLSSETGLVHLDDGPDMVLFETPTNPFLKTIDIGRVCQAIKQSNPNALVVVDNTWATPLFQKPLRHGADVALYSNSKFHSGHSDIITGLAVTKITDVGERLARYRFYAGCQPDPFAAWLLRRSLQTLPVRMARHAETTRRVTTYLEGHRMVTEVWLAQTRNGQLEDYAGMLFFRLRAGAFGTVVAFMDALNLFDRGTSMASVASAVANPWTGSHLSMTDDEKRVIGLDEFVVRLSIGLESPEDLLADLDQAFVKAARVDASA